MALSPTQRALRAREKKSRANAARREREQKQAAKETAEVRVVEVKEDQD
jgi:hypothetical protein